MGTEKACKKCHMLLKEEICPICKDSELTPSWKGFTIVTNSEKSEVAKILNINTVGKYALRLGK